MQTAQSDYFSAYRQLKLTRDAKGVLVVEFHSNGGPCIMNAQGHTEFVDAFYRIGQDLSVAAKKGTSSAVEREPGAGLRSGLRWEQKERRS